MRKSDCRNAINKLYVGEILILLTVFSSLSVLDSVHEIFSLFGLFALCGLVGVVFQVIGIIKVRKINNTFNNAFLCFLLQAILWVGCAILSALDSNEADWIKICLNSIEVAISSFGIYTTYYVICGCGELINKKKGTNFGKGTKITYSIMMILIIVLQIIEFFNIPESILLIIELITMVLEIVSYFMYVVLLGKTVKKLN